MAVVAVVCVCVFGGGECGFQLLAKYGDFYTFICPRGGVGGGRGERKKEQGGCNELRVDS